MAEHECCDNIIKAEVDIDNIGGKVGNLEKLYKPVYICMFILTTLLVLGAYFWGRVDDMQNKVNDIAKDTALIMQDIRNIKEDVNEFKQRLERHKSERGSK